MRRGGKAMREGTYAENADKDEEADFEEMPITVKVDLEQNELARAEGIHGLRAQGFFVSSSKKRNERDR